MILPMRNLLVLAFVFTLAAWAGPATARSHGGDAAEFEQGKTLYEAREFEPAFAILRPLAHAGHAEAQYVMGRAYENGSGPLTFDAVTSFDWYLKAVKKGSAQARKRLMEIILLPGRRFLDDYDYAKLILSFYQIDGNWLLYARSIGSQDGKFFSPDTTTVELPQAEILRTMWLIVLAESEPWSARIKLFLNRYSQPENERTMAETLAREWLQGDLEAWIRTELIVRAGRPI